MLNLAIQSAWGLATKLVRFPEGRRWSGRKSRATVSCILEFLEERSLLNGIWISTEELMQLPTSGPAWDTVLATANTTTGTPAINNQDDKTDTTTLAMALVGV